VKAKAFFITMFTVYIIFSISKNNYYTGQTKDFENRLSLHNSGQVKSTKSGMPWNIVKVFVLNNRKEAVRLEEK